MSENLSKEIARVLKAENAVAITLFFRANEIPLAVVETALLDKEHMELIPVIRAYELHEIKEEEK